MNVLRRRRWTVLASVRCLSSGTGPSVLMGELHSRGLVQAVTSNELERRLARPATVYCGVDPTADSLHVGNLLPLTCLLRFLVHGHRVLGVVGGATGAIGDPSGRSSERQALAEDVLERNIRGVRTQVERFFERGVQHVGRHQEAATAIGQVAVLNNADWTKDMSLLAFLGDIGRLARVSTMLNRESVKARMETDQGISFTEFTYQLLQAYDFWYLYEREGCSIQIGGSDQWGNIVAGIDLIRRKREAESSPSREEAFGITLPLITTASGEKFGKSAGNAVWLDERRTSIFDFYQFFKRTQDADVERYLHLFTFLPLDSIKDMMAVHQTRPEQRVAQRALAYEVTALVHTAPAAEKAQLQSDILYPAGGPDAQQTHVLRRGHSEAVLAAFRGDPRLVQIDRLRYFEQGADVASMVSAVVPGLSRTAVIKHSAAGGLYLNGRRETEAGKRRLSQADLVDDRYAVVRVGKRDIWLVQVAEQR
ncbi:tyrosyl-tRNA synthetase [Sorochytrium milnesiophthora]